MKYMIPIFLCASMLLAGCSTWVEFRDPERLEQVKGIDKHSSYPSVRREPFERINLLELVDPGNLAEKRFEDNWKRTNDSTANTMGAKYDLALASFRERDDISAEEKRQRRNGIQERMLSVSISRCNVFKTYLRRNQADKNFLLGSATTVAAVLGAVLPGADAARYLAGSAGIFSGIRSEYNQAYFAGLGAHVIAKGIETRQELVYRRIQTEGQCKSIDAYPLEAAIKDAIYFDGLCSVVEGLDQASVSIDATTEPGLDATMRTVLRARLLKEAADMPREMLLKPETLDSIGLAGSRLGLSLVGSTLGEPVGTAVETDLFITASNMVERINAAADDAVLLIEKAALDRKKEFFDKFKDNDSIKTLTEEGPKDGKIVEAIRPKVTTILLKPLMLDACYSKLAVSAIQQRIEAAKLLTAATNDSTHAVADLALGEAARAVAAAHEKLRAKERLVMTEITNYREARILAIQQVELEAKKETLDELTKQALLDPPAPTFSKIPSCSD